MTAWKELKKDLAISQEDQNAIALERDLIRTMAAIREEKQSVEDFNASGVYAADCAFG